MILKKEATGPRSPNAAAVSSTVVAVIAYPLFGALMGLQLVHLTEVLVRIGYLMIRRAAQWYLGAICMLTVAHAPV
jgi:hypothetical protein